MMKQRCPCGNQRPYLKCCGLYIESFSESLASGGDLLKRRMAPTAEALMRSRYTAFTQGNIDYLVQTHHPNNRSANAHKSLERSVRQTRWANLIIVKTQKGQKKDKTGTVEFVAAFQSAQPIGAQLATNKIEQLHERSSFVREKGEWFYTDGEMLADYVLKRSQPCWCGSKKRFKHCHA